MDRTHLLRTLCLFPRLVLGCMHGGRNHGEHEGGRSINHYGWITLDCAASAYDYLTQDYTSDELSDEAMEQALLLDWGYSGRHAAQQIRPTYCVDVRQPNFWKAIPDQSLECVVDERLGVADGVWEWIGAKVAPGGYLVALGEGHARLRHVQQAHAPDRFRSIAPTQFVRDTEGQPYYADLHTFMRGFWRLLADCAEPAEEEMTTVLQRL